MNQNSSAKVQSSSADAATTVQYIWPAFVRLRFLRWNPGNVGIVLVTGERLLPIQPP